MEFCTVTVTLPVASVQERLCKSLFRLGSPYRGEMMGSGFRAVRMFSLFERTIPTVITGQLESGPELTVVHIAARPRWFTMIILIPWTVMWASLAYRFLRSTEQPQGAWLGVVFAFGMILFAWFLTLAACAIEARRFEAFVQSELRST
jgi:hypothetical protein